jgi:hypothetical protein
MKIDLPPSTYPIERGGFRVGDTLFLLRERSLPKRTNGKTAYFIFAIPGGYVSNLFPTVGPNQFRFDYVGPDGAERAYTLCIDTDRGIINIGGGDLSRRSTRPQPWQRSREQR